MLENFTDHKRDKIKAAMKELGVPSSKPVINSSNRTAVRSWLNGLGFPTRTYESATLAELSAAYKPLFPLGQCIATAGMHELILSGAVNPADLLSRHQQGDWGCVCDEDRATNDEALAHGNRIMSAYPIDPAKPCKGYGENCIWIITEADRSATTILLPEEY